MGGGRGVGGGAQPCRRRVHHRCTPAEASQPFQGKKAARPGQTRQGQAKPGRAKPGRARPGGNMTGQPGPAHHQRHHQPMSERRMRKVQVSMLSTANLRAGGEYPAGERRKTLESWKAWARFGGLACVQAGNADACLLPPRNQRCCGLHAACPWLNAQQLAIKALRGARKRAWQKAPTEAPFCPPLPLTRPAAPPDRPAAPPRPVRPTARSPLCSRGHRGVCEIDVGAERCEEVGEHDSGHPAQTTGTGWATAQCYSPEGLPKGSRRRETCAPKGESCGSPPPPPHLQSVSPNDTCDAACG